MRLKTVVLALACISISIGQTDGLAQSPQSFQSLSAALQKMQETYQISTGLETDLADTNKTPIMLDLSGRDIAATFEALVGQRPVYVWSKLNGVYDLYPRNQSESLSQLTVASFIVTNATLRQTQSALFNLPEVKAWLSEHHAARNALIVGGDAMPPKGAPNREPRRISLNLNHVQLSTILNQVIVMLGRPQWTIGHVAGGGGYAEYVSIEP